MASVHQMPGKVVFRKNKTVDSGEMGLQRQKRVFVCFVAVYSVTDIQYTALT